MRVSPLLLLRCLALSLLVALACTGAPLLPDERGDPSGPLSVEDHFPKANSESGTIEELAGDAMVLALYADPDRTIVLMLPEKLPVYFQGEEKGREILMPGQGVRVFLEGADVGHPRVVGLQVITRTVRRNDGTGVPTGLRDR